MSNPPTPPEGYRLAERGELYPRGPDCNKIYLSGLWLPWGEIDTRSWEPWLDGTPVYYAIPNPRP